MDGMNLSYKEYHENYMANHKGSTMWESSHLIVPYPILIFFVSYIVQLYSLSRLSLTSFLLEFIIIIFSLTLTYTIFNVYNHIICYVILNIYLFAFYNILRQRSRNLIKIVFNLVVPSQKRPFITYFRSICFLLTAFCILAVDFKIFPRRFAKTESYGFGLMDTGVGFFIVSNGFVVKADLRKHIIKALKSSLPLIFLGILRCVSIKKLDYHQHVSEYGIYWNFFFTLAVVKLICPLILANWPNGALWTSVLLAVMHQTALSSGIEEWVVRENTREDILSANKEGVVSLPGYLSLYLAAIYIGKVLNRDNIDLQADVIRSFKLFITSALFFFLTVILLPELNVSRRLINLTYITWILALTFLLLGLCIIVEISVRVSYFIVGRTNYDNIVPIIIDAVNYNSLTFFIIANMLTGVINICIKTLYVPILPSILILMIYMLFICFVTSFLYRYKIKISL